MRASYAEMRWKESGLNQINRATTARFQWQANENISDNKEK